jgi:formylglycine-generating enzyme required for sulfatase activity
MTLLTRHLPGTALAISGYCATTLLPILLCLSIKSIRYMSRSLTSYRSLLLSCVLLAGLHAAANNITTSAGSLTGNTGTQIHVQFNISWQNSWRIEPNRWDAAWVFVKYRTASGMWQHANLSNTGHVAPGGSTITTGLVAPASAFNTTTNPGVGVFIHRSAEGSGTFTANGVQLLWDYGANGINMLDVEEIRVFAIEMVHVPQGAFAVGSGGTENDAFTLTTINTANATAVPSGTGSLGGQAGGYPTGQIAPSNAAWPNGFNAFYCMKYELSQQQYVDFLNTLTRTQQNTRTATDISGTAITNRYVMSNTSALNVRNGIRCDANIPVSPAPVTFYCDLNGNGTGGEASDGKDIACNLLSWGDLAAYLDWSGLRPMTELEFEKACRGPIAPVANEYPWGTSGIAIGTYTLANAGATNEGIATNYSTTLGNAVYSGTGIHDGPRRVGILAANGSNNGRATAGAGYYGIMELGGNLWERPVTIGNANGRAYTGTHGNGALGSTGDPDVASWPAPTTANGVGVRGGSLDFSAPGLRVSDRNFAALASSDRGNSIGGRGCRLVP